MNNIQNYEMGNYQVSFCQKPKGIVVNLANAYDIGPYVPKEIPLKVPVDPQKMNLVFKEIIERLTNNRENLSKLGEFMILV